MKLLSTLMRRFVTTGRLTIIDHNGVRHEFGPGGEPSATIRITDPTLYRTLFFNPELHAGEAYMDGRLIVEEGGIRGFLEVFAHNRNGLRKGPVRQAIKRTKKRFRKLMQRNRREASSKNVEAHYDLSNDLYRLFLDEDMQYSCAYWPSPDITLEQAQLAKKRHIAAKLRLEPGMRVLDIGCGWGGFAIHAAKHYGVHVTGITISKEQLEFGQKRAREEGLEDMVNLKFQDYRDLTGTYDRIVSIEMVEALGFKFFDTYFRKVSEVLAPDGIAVIQAITFPEPHFHRYMRSVDFTKKHIFPGSLLLSLKEVFSSLNRTGDLCVSNIESIGLHYARTLRDWRMNFEERLEEVRALGFDDMMRDRGFSVTQIDRCLRDEAQAQTIKTNDLADRATFSITGTPTFALNGETLASVGDWPSLAATLQERFRPAPQESVTGG